MRKIEIIKKTDVMVRGNNTYFQERRKGWDRKNQPPTS